MANEPHRLRSLAFEWEKLAGEACSEYRDYKGRECVKCGESEGAHVYRRCAERLRALLAEPEPLDGFS